MADGVLVFSVIRYFGIVPRIIANPAREHGKVSHTHFAPKLRSNTDGFVRGDFSNHMTIDEFCALEKRPLPSDDVLISAAYLESKGFRFCVDYGIDNAKDVAERVMRSEQRVLSFPKEEKTEQVQEAPRTPKFSGIEIIGIEVVRRGTRKYKSRAMRYARAHRRRGLRPRWL